MDGSREHRFTVTVEAANAPVKALCKEESACLRWKKYGLPPCEGMCKRAAFLDNLPYEVNRVWP